MIFKVPSDPDNSMINSVKAVPWQLLVSKHETPCAKLIFWLFRRVIFNGSCALEAQIFDVWNFSHANFISNSWRWASECVTQAGVLQRIILKEKSEVRRKAQKKILFHCNVTSLQ